jgi:hypothetical protein
MAEPVINPASGVQQDSSTNLPTPQKQTSNAAWVLEQGNITGLRNPSSGTNAYLPVRQECNLSIISKTTAVTIGAGAANDTHLMGIYIHTALTGTLAITGFADSDGAAQTFTIPAGAVGEFDFKGAINSAGALGMTASNAGDDNKIAVFWRPV